MDAIHLSAQERRELRSQLGGRRDSRVYRRALALLELDAGRPLKRVAAMLHVNRVTLWRWCRRYSRRRGLEVLADLPRCGRRPVWTPEHDRILDAMLMRSPRSWGFAATQWNVPLLRRHLIEQGLPDCSKNTLRAAIHRLNWVWKRPRYVLEPDPEREKKKTHPDTAQAFGATGCGAL